MTEHLDLENWSCPLPLRDYPAIVMGHGGGGRLSAELVEHLFLPAFGGTSHAHVLQQLGDAAVGRDQALSVHRRLRRRGRGGRNTVEYVRFLRCTRINFVKDIGHQ